MFKKTIATALIAMGISGPAVALDMAPVLTLDVAKRMAEACEAMSAEKGWRMNIAIVDRGAGLVVFRRMDNSFLGSVEIAIGKAETSARFPFPTRFVEQLAYGKDGQPAGVPGIVHVPGIIAFAGGLPIKAGDAQPRGNWCLGRDSRPG